MFYLLEQLFRLSFLKQTLKIPETARKAIFTVLIRTEVAYLVHPVRIFCLL